MKGKTIKLLRKSNSGGHLHDPGVEKYVYFARIQVQALKKKIDGSILKIKNVFKLKTILIKHFSLKT